MCDAGSAAQQRQTGGDDDCSLREEPLGSLEPLDNVLRVGEQPEGNNRSRPAKHMPRWITEETPTDVDAPWLALSRGVGDPLSRA